MTARGGALPALSVDGHAFVRRAVGFARALDGAGIRTDPASAIDFVRALTIVDIGDRSQVHAAGSAVFVRRRDDLPVYDDVFAAFWRAGGGAGTDAPPRIEPPGGQDAPDDRDAGPPATPPAEGGAPDGEARTAGAAPTGEAVRADDGRPVAPERPMTAPHAYSRHDVIRHRRFDRMSEAELRDAERLIDALVPRLETRRTRRHELHPHGRLLAPRAMFRRNIKAGGDLVEWVWRRPVRHPRSIVVLCDISGSMERQSRLLLRFVQALSSSPVRTEAFVFGTRLTRVTRLIRDRDRDRGLSRVSAAVSDWSGGTRIGESFREFNRRWARRVLRTSGVVVVVSDGWDRGDPRLVDEQSARLARGCHRLIWLNPLASADGYEPLAAGMAAAYPHIDDFVAAGTVASLERLGELLAGVGGAGTPGTGGGLGATGAAGAPGGGRGSGRGGPRVWRARPVSTVAGVVGAAGADGALVAGSDA